MRLIFFHRLARCDTERQGRWLGINFLSESLSITGLGLCRSDNNPTHIRWHFWGFPQLRWNTLKKFVLDSWVLKGKWAMNCSNKSTIGLDYCNRFIFSAHIWPITCKNLSLANPCFTFLLKSIFCWLKKQLSQISARARCAHAWKKNRTQRIQMKQNSYKLNRDYAP